MTVGILSIKNSEFMIDPFLIGLIDTKIDSQHAWHNRAKLLHGECSHFSGSNLHRLYCNSSKIPLPTPSEYWGLFWFWQARSFEHDGGRGIFNSCRASRTWVPLRVLQGSETCSSQGKVSKYIPEPGLIFYHLIRLEVSRLCQNSLRWQDKTTNEMLGNDPSIQKFCCVRLRPNHEIQIATWRPWREWTIC